MIDVSSETEFEQMVVECLKIAATEPFILECIAENGDILDVALGPESCVLTLTPGSLEPPYLISVGQDETDRLLSYLLDDEPTEFEGRNAVSSELAIRALRHFFEESKPFREVVWEEV